MPGATGDTLLEVARCLQVFERLDRRAGVDPSDHDPRERLSHMIRLLVMVRYCMREQAPYKNCLIAVAVQAVAWASALKDRP